MAEEFEVRPTLLTAAVIATTTEAAASKTDSVSIGAVAVASVANEVMDAGVAVGVEAVATAVVVIVMAGVDEAAVWGIDKRRQPLSKR